MSTSRGDFLKAFEDELEALRRGAASFSLDYPDVAKHLGLEDRGDPSVQRLLEGVAFLGARTRMKIRASEQAVAAQLLDILVPSLARPIPSFGLVQFRPEVAIQALRAPIDIPAGTSVRLPDGRGHEPCVFKVCRPVCVAPVIIKDVSAVHPSTLGHVIGLTSGKNRSVRAAIKIDLELGAEAAGAGYFPDALEFFLDGELSAVSRLMKVIVMEHEAVFVATGAPIKPKVLSAGAIQLVGFEGGEGLLDVGPSGYDGHRLLAEYLVSPRCFQSIRMNLGGRAALDESSGTDARISVWILLDVDPEEVANDLPRVQWRLGVVPVVNRYLRRLDRAPVNHSRVEQPLVVDKLHALAHEVLRVESVIGYLEDGIGRPLRSVRDPSATQSSGARDIWYADRRVLNEWRSRRAGKGGPGSEGSSLDDPTAMLIALSGREAPKLQEIAVRAWVSDADRPSRVSAQTRDRATVDDIGGLALTWIDGPSKSRRGHLHQMDSHELGRVLRPSLDSLFCDGGPEAQARRLRELVLSFLPEDLGRSNPVTECLRAIETQVVVRPFPGPGPLCYAKGVLLKVFVTQADVDSLPIFTFGMVLREFLAGFCSINSFIELEFHTEGHSKHWRLPAFPGLGNAL